MNKNAFTIRARPSRIVTITWPDEFAVDDVEKFIATFMKELKDLRFYPVAIVDDLRNIKLGSVDRKLMTRVQNFLSAEEAFLGERLCGWADVSTSWALRSVLALLRMKTSAPYKRETFNSIEDAEKWCAKLVVHGR